MRISRAAVTLAFAALASSAAHADGPTVDEDARARAYFTDTELVNQAGAPVRFYSDVLRGKVVAISFIFTRCEGACPLLTAKLVRIREGLGDRFGSQVHFVSISVDPEHDTPAELRKFAEKNRAAGAGWTFLTGKPKDVEFIVKRLGQYAANIEEHSTMFLAGNVPKAHWMKIRPDMPPEAVVQHLEGLADEGIAAAVAPAAASPSR